MFENIMNFFKKLSKKEKTKESSDTAKERLHLVLMQDRANVSADFLELMKQEIIEVIKKYIDIDEKAIDVKLTNKPNEDGTVGAPALYANIPIITIKNEARKVNAPKQEEEASHQLEKQNKNENKQEVASEEIQEKKQQEETEAAKTDNGEEAKQEENQNAGKEWIEEKASEVSTQENVSEIGNAENKELEQEIENCKQEQTEKQTEEQETKAQTNS